MDWGFNFSMTESEAKLLLKVLDCYTSSNKSEQACIILKRLNEQIEEMED